MSGTDDAWERWTTDARGVEPVTFKSSRDATSPEDRAKEAAARKVIEDAKAKAREEAGPAPDEADGPDED